jgi:uncharacterized paraquat-inducible protein A
MDQLLLVLLVLTAAIAIAAMLLSRTRRRTELAALGPPESQYAVSTEGMKVCPKCGMGNMWTERRCSACGTSLKG